MVIIFDNFLPEFSRTIINMLESSILGNEHLHLFVTVYGRFLAKVSYKSSFSVKPLPRPPFKGTKSFLYDISFVLVSCCGRMENNALYPFEGKSGY